MIEPQKLLKAYQVSDGDEGCVIRFATNSATARREGANEIGTDWECIESCSRKPEYDQFAPGPVPAVVLIASGWGYECLGPGCSGWVTANTDEICFSASGDPYCCPTCLAKDFSRQRGRAAAEAAIQEYVELRLPGAAVKKVYVYGSKLEAAENGGGYRAYVDFKFSGAQHLGQYVFGEDGYRIHGDDIEAFRALYPAPEPEPQSEAP